jgi:hypothetical protein
MQVQKDKQLGQSFGSACGKLRRMMMFHMAQQLQQDQCMRCRKKIERFEDFTLDHKVDWQNNDPALFWDISNIGFSHAKCNRPRHFLKRKVGPTGTAWCGKCRDFLTVESFAKSRRHWNGFKEWCRKCTSEYDATR